MPHLNKLHKFFVQHGRVTGLVLFFSVLLPLIFPFTVFALGALDTFTDVAGTLLDAHTSNNGHTYSRNAVVPTGTMVITNNNRLRTDNLTAVYHSNWVPSSTNYDVDADIYIASVVSDGNYGLGLGGRAGTGAFTGYYAVLYADTPATVRLYRGGNGAALGTYAVPIIAGETHALKLRMIGGRILVYWDGASVIDVTPAGADIVSVTGTAAIYGQSPATNSTGFHLDNFSTTDGNPLLQGVLSRLAQTSSTVTLAWTSSTGGVAPVTAQLQRSPTGAATWGNVSGATTSPFTDTGLTPLTGYDYRVSFTDASSTVVFSNTVTATTTPVLVGAYSAAVSAESTLLSYWPMTETAGTLSLTPATGTIAMNLTGATAGVTGRTGGTAVSFDGINDFGATASNLNFTGSSRIVVEALVNYDNIPGQQQIAWESTVNAAVDTTGFLFLWGDDSVPPTSNALVKGDAGYNYALYTQPSVSTWHHVVSVFNKGATTDETDLYVDGVLKVAVSRPIQANNANNFGFDPFYLMSRAGTTLFTKGKMQHLAIYSDLSATQILAHYRLGFASTTAGVLSESSHSTSTATFAWTSSTGVAVPITEQLQRSLSGQGSWTNVGGATLSPATDTGLATSTAYDYRVAFTDASSTVVFSNTVAVTTDGPPTSTLYTVQRADLWDNAYDNVASPRQSTFSRFIFTTNATSVVIGGVTGLYDAYPQFTRLGLRVDGVNQSPLVFAANGTQNFTVTLGSPGTTKTVEITPSVQSIFCGGCASVAGSFVNSVTYPVSNSFAVSTPTFSNRTLFYGDSISVGGNATNPETEGYVPLLRNTYGLSVMLEGWGGRSLYDDANTSGLRAAFINRVTSTTPSMIWLAIGTNDYGLNEWSASSFGTAYAAVLDDLHAALPSTAIICQTPIIRASEAANGSGNTLSDYRAQITTVCNARSWTKLIDGSVFLTTGDLEDGVHPTTAGQAKYAKRIAPLLANPSYSVSGPSSGPASGTSTAFTVTLGNGAPFLGDQAITISDGGNGGTFTPSVGASGISSVTVTSTASSTSFTFTYRPASVGAKTFTFTNNQNWYDHSTTTYNSISLAVALTSGVSNPTNVTPFTVTSTFSEDVTGFTLSDISVGNGTASAFTTSTSAVYSFLITPAGDGLVTVDVATSSAFATGTTPNNAAPQFSVTFDGTAPDAPLASPAAGSYTSAQSVTLSSAGSSLIRFTTDGTTPSCSVGTLYSGAITVSASQTITAVGCDDAGNQSSVSAFAYVITSSSGGGGGGGGVSGPGGGGMPSTNSPPVSPPVPPIFPQPPGLPDTGSGGTGNPSTPGTPTLPTNPATGASIKGIPAGFRFNTDLRFGQTLQDVKYLQIILNSDPDTQVAKTGPGSPEHETSFFGALTLKAVTKFQEKYAQEILAPWHFTKGTGFVSKTTRAKLNSILASNSVASSAPVSSLKRIPTDFRFNKGLAYGRTDIEIKWLQIILNSDPDTQVAKTGPGSPEHETNVFGALTLKAVIKFQEKYASAIFPSPTVRTGRGFVGVMTRAKLNSLLAK